MCGFAGAVWTNPSRAVSPEILQRMTAALAHRGPDGEGFFRSESLGGTGCALGHRRLAIIAPADNPQPAVSDDQQTVVVFNGAIYNYRELHRQLSDRGIALRTSGDAEVLLGLYRLMGSDMFSQLRGMFALALWDAREERLLLARDRFGKKPLVYYACGERLLFASVLTALLEHPEVPRDLDPIALDAYLSLQYIPHPRTIIAGMSKLPPGCWARFDRDGLYIRRFASAFPLLPCGIGRNPFHDECDRTDGKENASSVAEPWNHHFGDNSIPSAWLPPVDPLRQPAEALRAALTRAVELRLRCDVPVGVFLSGGIDSTIVAGVMRCLGVSPLRTYSIGFDDSGYDESSYAELAARAFGAKHHLQRLDAQIAGTLPDVVAACDEPMADSSLAAAWHLAALAERDIRVALSGEGGDELFWGYPRYTAVWLAELLSRMSSGWVTRSTWLGRFGLPAAMGQKGLLRRARRFLAGLSLPPAQRYAGWMELFSADQRVSLYNSKMHEALAAALAADELRNGPAGGWGERFLVELWNAASCHVAFEENVPRSIIPLQAVAWAAWVDAASYLPCDLMTKTDRATMAHSIECRCPWLDPAVAAVANAIPPELKFRRGRGKHVVREAFADLLPAPIARRRKMGFGVPIAGWLRGPWRDLFRETLLDPGAFCRKWFDAAYVQHLLDAHACGQADHSHRLWALYVWEMWCRQRIPPTADLR